VVNAGGWGTALAMLLANAGHAVRLWCRRPELAAEILATRENRAYLPGVILPPALGVTADLREALAEADAAILVPISRAARQTARLVAQHLPPGVPVAHASKGFEPETRRRLSETVAEELGAAYRERVAVIVGPTHAEEVARGLPTAAVVACQDAEVAATFQGLLHGRTFRVYTSSDVIGVEVCAALKNVIALAIGGADGLGYGDNARAALITRSLVEIGRLVMAEGGDVRTVAGLAGLGDVVATCTSRHSRNRWAGEQLGRGRALEEVLSSTPQVVEGIPTTLAARQLAEQLGVELPICEEVYRVIYGGASVHETLAHLMGREATAEL
jgi:glycerol-3-phosphate dehydrogenase (NAD(P)+)